MNARALEASAIHEFMFGDRQLHTRFSMAIVLLARLVIANPRPLTTIALSEALGEPPRTVRALLANLHHSGLLCKDGKARDAWSCSTGLGSITLADVFRSVAGTAPGQARRKKTGTSDEPRTASQQGVELLLMQATMAINQVVLQHLQAFDLGRLKAVGPLNAVQRFNPSTRSYIEEPVVW